MERYVVVCDCRGSDETATIATILDDRAESRQFVVVPGGHDYRYSYGPMRNRRGSEDSTPIKLRCASCNRAVTVTWLTVRDVVDSITDKNSLRLAQLAPDETSAWLSDLIDSVGGNNHRVIPFRAICYAVTKLTR